MYSCLDHTFLEVLHHSIVNKKLIHKNKSSNGKRGKTFVKTYNSGRQSKSHKPGKLLKAKTTRFLSRIALQKAIVFRSFIALVDMSGIGDDFKQIVFEGALDSVAS